MAAAFLLLLLVFAGCVTDLAEWILVVRFPGFAEQLVQRWDFTLGPLKYLPVPVACATALYWTGLLGLAARGSTRPAWLVRRLSGKSWIVRCAQFANRAILGLVPIGILVAVHANSLTRQSVPKGAVYFLYDEGVAVPRWGFAAGLYRISLQAEKNWGKGSVILDRLNPQTLRTALADGNVVILATHGSDGYVVTSGSSERIAVWPPDSGATDAEEPCRCLNIRVRGKDHQWSEPESVPVGEHLKLVYVFACNAGVRADQWNERLAPAQVLTYNRFSSVWDHARWFAFLGPLQLAELQ